MPLRLDRSKQSSSRVTFSSPEAALLLVSTKNRDLWGPIFLAWAEILYPQPIRFVRHDSKHGHSAEIDGKSVNR